MIAFNLLFAVLFSIASGLPAAHVEASSLTVQELQAMAMAEATSHHLNINHFLDTINCESQWGVDSIGDQGTSFGIAQIHLPAHPDITKEEALDPEFSLDWMANEWQNDRASEWSCWSNYSKTGWPK